MPPRPQQHGTLAKAKRDRTALRQHSSETALRYLFRAGAVVAAIFQDVAILVEDDKKNEEEAALAGFRKRITQLLCESVARKVLLAGLSCEEARRAGFELDAEGASAEEIASGVDDAERRAVAHGRTAPPKQKKLKKEEPKPAPRPVKIFKFRMVLAIQPARRIFPVAKRK